MSEYVQLIGTEQVQNAANTMRNAADQMQRAASEIQYSFEAHHRFLENWLQEFRSAIESLKP